MRYALLSIVFFCCLLSCGEDGLFHQDDATENDDTELIVENGVQENDANSDEFLGVVVPVGHGVINPVNDENDQTPLRPDPFKLFVITPELGSFIPTKSVVEIGFDKTPPAHYRFTANRPVIGDGAEVVRVLQTNSIKIYLNHTYDEGEIKFRLLWDGGGIELNYTLYRHAPLQTLEASTFKHRGTYFDVSKARRIHMVFNKKLTGTIKFLNELGEQLPWSDGVLENQNSTVLEFEPPGERFLENGVYSLTGDVTDIRGNKRQIDYKFTLISRWRVSTINGQTVWNYLRREANRMPQNVNIRDVLSNEFVFSVDGRWSMRLKYTYKILDKGFGDFTREGGMSSSGDYAEVHGVTSIHDIGPNNDVDVRISLSNHLGGSLIFSPKFPPPKPQPIGRVVRKPLWAPPPVPLDARNDMPRDFLLKRLVMVPKDN